MKTLTPSLTFLVPPLLNTFPTRVNASEPGFCAQLVDALPVYVAHFDRELRFLYVNRRYAEMLGQTPEQVIGRLACDLMPAASLAAFMPSFARVLSGERVHHVRQLQIREVGLRHLDVTLTPQRDEANAVTGFLCVLLDATDAVEARGRAQQADDRFRALAMTVNETLWDLDIISDTMWVTQSNAYPRQIPPSDHLAWWRQRIHPTDRERAMETVRESLSSGAGWRSAYRFLADDGRYRHLVDRAMIMRDTRGGAVRALGVSTDVTSRAHAEALLAAQNRVLECEHEGASLEEVLGVLTTSLEELAPEPLHALLTLQEGGVLRLASGPTLPRAFAEQLAMLSIGPQAGACGRAAWLKQTVVVHDVATDPLFEEVRDVLLAAGLRACFSVPITDAGGDVLAVLSIFYERAQRPHPEDVEAVRLLARTAGLVIERRRAAETLQRQSEITHTITENAAAALFLLDEHGRPTYMNRAAQSVTGHFIERLLVRSIHDVLHASCDDTACPLRAALEQGDRLPAFETDLRRANGTVFPAACHYTPVRHQGRLRGGVLEVRGLTEQLAARDLQETNRRLAELHRLKTEFVSTMSHELRTPLNSIIGFTEVLLDELSGPLNDLQRRHLRLVGEAGDNLLRLINEILEISRLEAGKGTLEPRPFDLSESLRTWIESLRPEADKKQVAMREEGLGSACEMRSDEHRIRQIILNLLSNAVKFTPQGSVVVRLETGPAQVCLRIDDSGPGIAPQHLSQLFQPFGRLGRDPKNEGSGLGLHISQKLTGLLGGTLTLSSEEGSGTSVRLILPRVLQEETS